MKNLLILLFLLNTTLSYSQTVELNLPLLKQNKEIDSVMKIVINDSKATHICFSLTTIHTPYGYQFIVLRLGKMQNNVFYHALQPYDIKELGYFKTKAYTVFVSGDDSASKYFTPTVYSKKFRTVSLKDTMYWFTPNSTFKDDPEHRAGKFMITSRDFRDKGTLITPKN